MSLDWDTSKIEDRPTKFPGDENGQMNSALHVMIWLTMATGIDEVTKDNVDEWWVRVNLWQQTIGSGYTKVISDDTVEPFLITKEAAYNAVGLKTNAGRKTQSEFLKHLHAAAHRVML